MVCGMPSTLIFEQNFWYYSIVLPWGDQKDDWHTQEEALSCGHQSLRFFFSGYWLAPHIVYRIDKLLTDKFAF